MSGLHKALGRKALCRPSLRAVDISADVMLRATQAASIFDKDATENPDAVKYNLGNHDEVVTRKFALMSTTAIVMCPDNELPVKVFNLG